MFKNYLLVAWRSLKNNKAVSIINILGLTLGLASAILAILYAHHELTFEDTHSNADRIGKVYIHGNFGELKWTPTCFGPDGRALKNLFPEIEKYSRTMQSSGHAKVGQNNFLEDHILFADSAFYEILTIQFIAGSPALANNNVIISEKTSTKYFSNLNPLGQTITISTYGITENFIITGVFKDFPSNTHLEATLILPFTITNKITNLEPDKYHGTNFDTYLLFKSEPNIKTFNQKIITSYNIPVNIDDLYAYVMPLKEIHMNGSFSNNKGKLLIFLVGGLFVLIIASLNYINLTNILFSTRIKEIGIRKVNGSKQNDIFLQFLSSTFLSTFLAFAASLVVLALALPWFNSLMDTNISLNAKHQTVLLLITTFMVTVAISGLYPAFKHATSKPINLLKSTNSNLNGKNYSLWILTTFQFMMAIIFIQYLMALNKLLIYMDSVQVKKYNSENVYCINGYHWGDLNQVKQELVKNPMVENITWGSNIPAMGFSITKEWKDDENQQMAIVNQFEEDYPEVFKINLQEGRFFSQQFPSDATNSIVINELTAQLLGHNDPVGKDLLLHGKHYTIIGVIDNYMAVPPIFDHMPMLITMSNNTNHYLAIRIKPENIERTTNYISSILKEFNPDYPIELKTHNEIIMGQEESKSYVSAQQLSFLFFGLNIICALIGLFGLSLFIAERKRKEIGIRKVCGASVSNIMVHLSKGLAIQVVLAFVLATPIAINLIKTFYSVFPFQIHPGLEIFLLGGFLTLLMVMATISWKTRSAAMSNPTDTLRYE